LFFLLAETDLFRTHLLSTSVARLACNCACCMAWHGM
jgi:hypothetical protein